MFSLANVELSQLKDGQFLTTYLLGFLIIVMFAKDKFNIPIFDKETIGPFSQLPPQALTIDSRYQWGRLVYIGLLTALYTAICIIGPTTFNFDVTGIASQHGIASSAQIWPVAAATFLISTGAVKDDSLLGRIEKSIRQYAHKTAYIPTAVNDLAFSLRNQRVGLWLIQDPSIDEAKFQGRRAAFGRLVGDESVKKFEENPAQEGGFTAWLRANMLFSALLQIFGEGQAISNQRLASLADQQENLDIFERLKTKQKSLASQLSAVKDQGNSSADQIHADVQRFAKDASLTIAVLLARSAKNGSELTQLLTQLGFQDVYARNRTDHFVYIFLVNVFIFFGVVVACLLLVAPVIIPALFKSINLTDEDMTKSVVAVLMGFLIYLVMFRVLDYSRDRLLEAQDWQEGLVSYAKITLSSSLLSGVISIVIAALLVVVTLFLTSFDLLSFIARTPLELIIFVLFQAVLAALGTGFGLIYMRQAARLDRARLKLARNLLSGTALLHACFAAALVGFISLFTYTQQIGSEPRYSAERVAKNFSTIKPTLTKSTIRGPINNYSYSVYSQADASLIDRNLRQIKDAWKGQLYGVKEIDDQQKWLAEICVLLNSKFKFKDEEDEGDPVKLFKNPQKCVGQQEEVGGRADSKPVPKAEVTPESAKAPGPQANSEGQFFEFVVYLSKLYGQLDGLRPENKWSKAAYVAYQFPGIVAFILAYAFGVGCRFWRAWWLYNEVSRSDGHGQKLLEQLRKSYGDKVDFDRCLVMPIPSLGNVTALEALRYEDYRVKLFTKIQKQQVDWDAVRGAFKSTVH